MKRILVGLVASGVVLTLSSTALAKPNLPPAYTFERGLVQVTGTPASKAEVARTARTREDLAAIAASEACWQHHWKYERGHLVYYRAISQRTFWCSNWSYITYRSTETWPDTGFLCYPSWGPVSEKSGGGVGYWYVDVHSRGQFGCNVNYFIYYDWIDFTIRYTYYGSSYSV